MKGKKLHILLMFLLVAGIASVYTISNFNEPEAQKEEIDLFKKQKGIKGAMTHFYRLKLDPATQSIDPKKVKAAQRFAANLATSKNTSFNWQEMGPSNVGGRVRAILIDQTDHTIMYAGGVSGGLWKSTTSGLSWNQIELSDNIAVVSIAQAPNGDIYVGTGEGLASAAYTNFNSGQVGGGIYRSTDGQNFNLLSSTTSWDFVNRLAVDQYGVVWAATNFGLKTSADNGATWANQLQGSFQDVRIGIDGKVVAVRSGNVWISQSSHSDSIDFVDQALASNITRTEVAISPSNPDVIYAVLVAGGNNYGRLHSIHRTTNGGGSWAQIGVGGSSTFNLFGDNNQGWYDVTVMVKANNPNIVYVGGIHLWKGEFISANNPFSWTQISSSTDFFSDGTPNPRYVHVDMHTLVQHPTQANTFFVGNDGGVFRTQNSGNSFVALNTNLNITQFYAVSTNNFGHAIGGTQDNSNPYLDKSLNNPMEARVLYSGDGGWAAVSQLNVKQVFVTSQYAGAARSDDNGVNWQNTQDFATNSPEFFSQRMLDAGIAASFVTPLLLWETSKYPNSIDSVDYIADTNYAAGETILIRSKINANYPFEYTLTQNISTGDTIHVTDPVQSRFYLGVSNGVWMTKEALYYGGDGTPEWFKMVNTNDVVTVLANSKDGDVLYLAAGQQLVRVSNILAAQDSAAIDVTSATRVLEDTVLKSFSTYISSIAVDPQDANNVIVTLGGFTSNYPHVYYSNNALSSSANFVSKKGNLDGNLPVYASLIPVNKSKQVIIGTEFGMMATDDITSASPVWYNANAGIDDMVPIYMLAQQADRQAYKTHVVYDNGNPIVTVYPGIYNHGEIYAATHGRGMFKSDIYVGIDEMDSKESSFKSNLKLYPNPTSANLNAELDINNSKDDVIISIFDINGKFIKQENRGKNSKGLQQFKLNVNNFKPGIYILNINIAGESISNKFVVN